jgi:hypothetical protein
MARPGLDPKGYYAILGVTPQADTDAVKRAYRTRAKLLHPDRNPSPRASQEFNALTEAYGVLRDPRARRAYDSGLDTRRDGPASPVWSGGSAGGPGRDGPALGLRTCDVCGRTTLDLRFRVLHRVRGRGLRVVRAPIAGVFCRTHGERTAVAASLTCWALGWWALPWGPVATVAALWRNFRGGTHPAGENFQLLAGQARAFLARGNLPVARRLTEQARHYAHTPAEKAHIAQLLDTLADQPAPRRRLDRAPWLGAAQMAQLAPLLLIAVIALYIAGPGRVIGAVMTLWPTDPPATLRTPQAADQGPVSGTTRPPADPPSGDAFSGRTRPEPDPAGPTVAPGQLRAVAPPTVPVFSRPDVDAPIVATMSRATVVMVTAVTPDGAWSRVLSAKGVAGYVATGVLMPVARPDPAR